ncbi:MAG: peptide chain release factor 3 [Pseudonocardiaceae bacterium]|nr:peptide chain release factor 3 [Pseudonocardiaceae bacterium]
MTPAPGVLHEAARRRTFAVISHPDAGKSTLTEALALHAEAITEAGAVHGKGGRRGVVSDWLDMERARGISITSAALQFVYRDTVINLVDTPGHADFSEDTYRVLTAVDAAVMLLDAAKGLEPQTLKLFEVCRHRGIPVLTFINKWDRVGREALQLCDELTDRIGLQPMPLNWPVGPSGRFRGLRECATDRFIRFRRTPGGATAAAEEYLDASAAQRAEGADWVTAGEECELLESFGGGFDAAEFSAGKATPVLFGAAVLNTGVRQLLDVLVEHAPAAAPRADRDGVPRPLDSPLSGFVFKVQTGMDPAHRDQVAFLRVCSGRFERGMQTTVTRTGRTFATKYVQQMFGRDRTTVDIAYPGDVIGLVNATALQVGDTLHDGSGRVEYPPFPAFAPEHFAVARPRELDRSKHFRRGIAQLEQEGVVQVLRSDRRGDAAPVLAAVGPMQFDVAAHRLRSEFGVEVVLDRLPYTVARRIVNSSPPSLGDGRGEAVRRDRDGVLIALFRDRTALGTEQRLQPGLELEPLAAGA